MFAGKACTKAGAIVSSTVIFCVQVVVFNTVFSPVSLISLLLLSTYSVTIYVLVMVCGQVPAFALLLAVISITPQGLFPISPFAFPKDSNSISV